jgi:hypothetical protein
MSLYIGRDVDAETLAPAATYAILDPDALTRHAVCLGMTGSGKTGLCVALLEELAMAGVPVLLIDPKGDMGNLALAFSEHAPNDFAPWVDPAEAKKKGVSVQELAASLSERYREQLAEWQVGPERIDAFTKGAKVTVYTPGSSAGVGVDVLSSLFAPPADLGDAEAVNEALSAAVQSLLGLIGHDGDPLTDPATLVVSQVLASFWEAGETPGLDALIPAIVDPPFAKVGVFPVDKFFPRNERMKLAMALNALAASPAFAAWAQGQPLDAEAFLTPVENRTPISIFYLAHLDEPRRMFFISALLQNVVRYSRRLPGTSSLRALVYFDEVYGYLPPYPKNPPVKKPVLTLMKQARAVGIGTMLVTQNPVDLDYSAIANAGTWFIGRLQTKQDRDKVIDGLAGAGGNIDVRQIDEWIARLPARAFVLREPGASEPRLITSRQTISFLRGPLTRQEIERLSGKVRTVETGPPPPGMRRALGSTGEPSGAGAASVAPRAAAKPPNGYTAEPAPAPDGYCYRWLDPSVVFSSRLQAVFGGAAQPPRDDGRMTWEPALYARLFLRFDSGTEYRFDRDEQRLFFPLRADFRVTVEPAFEDADFVQPPDAPAWYAPLPSFLDEARELKAMEKRVVDDVLRGEVEKMFKHKALRLDGRAGESRDDFEARCFAVLQDRIDADVAKLQERVTRELKRLEERRERLQLDKQRHQSDASYRQVNEVVGAGEALMGLFFGRRSVGSSVSSAMSRRNQASQASQRAARSDSDIQRIENEVYELEQSTEAEIEKIKEKHLKLLSDVDEVDVRLRKDAVRLGDFGILWIPVNRAL